MTNMTGSLEVTTPSDREIVMTRSFNAPAALVWDAWTKPELITRWLGLMPGWSFTSCDVDLRVGGAYRFAWNGPENATLGLGGTYSEVTPTSRLVCTERFDAPFDNGEGLSTLELFEVDGKTRVVSTSLAPSKEIRDGVLESGMTSGVELSYNLLEELLVELTK